MDVYDRRYYLGGRGFDAGKLKVKRDVHDYGSSMSRYLRLRKRGRNCHEAERSSASYIVDMLPPQARIARPADTIPAKCLHQSSNKNRHPINVVRWTPEGRRLLTGSSSGEFTLWNGMSFNFETIMSAHDSAIRAAEWSHDDTHLLSADQDGNVKYWQRNLNNIKIIQAHDSAIRDLAFAPTDSKFVTASDDASLKVFDFVEGAEDLTLTGHGWDAKTVDWHPTKGLLVSGSKDHQVKLWDPRNGRCLTTLHGHKTTISRTSFQPTGNNDLLATCARDTVARIFDIRMMRDIMLLRGHEKDVTTLSWHPVHPNFITTGSNDGALHHYLLDEPNNPSDTSSLSPYDSVDPVNAQTQTLHPAHKVPFAHEQAIWSLDWHPVGHLLASGSNDRLTRFWTRARPGDESYRKDPYHIGQEASKAAGFKRNRMEGRHANAVEEGEIQHDEDDADGLIDQTMPAKPASIPGLPGLSGLPGLQNAMSQQQDSRRQVSPSNLPIPGAPQAFQVPPMAQNANLSSPHTLSHGMDMTKFQELIRAGQLPPPPQLGQFAPPPPQFSGQPDVGQILPSSFGAQGYPSLPGMIGGTNGNASVRKRAPLPSQQDSLREEMRRGNYRRAQ
ncbi:MAG: hypothetical protein Q9162_000130 [Coniocarpon cinnabarinum]